jgi:hypothetical protein
MGSHRNKRTLNLLGGLGVLMMTAAAVGLLLSWL